jgi:hypothetical protein
MPRRVKQARATPGTCYHMRCAVDHESRRSRLTYHLWSSRLPCISSWQQDAFPFARAKHTSVCKSCSAWIIEPIIEDDGAGAAPDQAARAASQCQVSIRLSRDDGRSKAGRVTGREQASSQSQQPDSLGPTSQLVSLVGTRVRRLGRLIQDASHREAAARGCFSIACFQSHSRLSKEAHEKTSNSPTAPHALSPAALRPARRRSRRSPCARAWRASGSRAGSRRARC